MRGNSKQGFSIMEAIIALVVLVLSLTPIMMLQLNDVRATSRYARLFERIQHATTFINTMLMQSAQEKKSEEKIINRPKTTMVLTQERVSKDSSLTVFPSLTYVRATLRWRDEDNKDRSELLVTYRYRPVSEGAE